MFEKFPGKLFKIVVLTLGLVLAIVLTAVTINNLLVYAGQQRQASELFGTYKVEKIIYAHPLIEFTEESLQLLNVSLDEHDMTLFYENKPQDNVSINYEKADLSVDDFSSSFNLEYYRPDVSS